MTVHPQFNPHHRHPHQLAGDGIDANGLSTNNPYANFRVCCTSLYTKDHAQLCGVVSFSLFLCLVVISLMFFGSLSIFYIVSGVIVYSLLMKSLFGLAEKSYVLFYLLFEAVQIGFHLALILYYLLPAIFSQLPSKQCQYNWTFVNGTRSGGSMTCRESTLKQEYMELLLFIIILISVKLYFARVIAHFYKYLVWNDKFVLHTAQYINGRGVQLSAALDRIFPMPPPTFWDIPPGQDDISGYGGYVQQQQQHPENQQRINVAHFLPAALPSYMQVCQQQQQQQKQSGLPTTTMEMPPSAATGNQHQQQNNGGNSQSGNANAIESSSASAVPLPGMDYGMQNMEKKLHLHV